MNNMTFKRKYIKKFRILILLSLLFFSFFINTHHIFNKSLSKYNPDYYDLKGALSWGKIHINNNWSLTESTHDWCTGSGTWSDPYVIQDLIIDGQGSSYCILIENSFDFFQIENCTTYNTGDDSDDAGIILSLVNNGTLINNNCSSNQRSGIHLLDCNNITIRNNELSDNRYGMVTENSYFNYISDNICINNHVGIVLSQIEDSTISNNNISNNIYQGMNSYNFINSSILNNNITENGDHGLYFSDGCDFNTISGNSISNNKETGMYISSSDNNTISSNYINYNQKIGVFLSNSGNTSFFFNNFKGCGFGLYGAYETLISNSINSNNLVNDKPVYYYVNKTSLKQVNFTGEGPPGQIILLGCNSSEISNFDISATSIGFALYYCNNVSISNNTVINNSYHAIELQNSNNCSIFENRINNTYNIGISLRECNNISVKYNNVSNNERGIYLSICYDCNISNNFVFNNSKDQHLYLYAKIGIELSASGNNLISGNTITNNSGIGIFLTSSDYNNLTENIVLNSSNGIHLDQSDHNNIINNTTSINTAKNSFLHFGDGGNGIALKTSNYNNLSINKVMYNRVAGIVLDDVTNVTITDNQMVQCGLVIYTSPGETPPFFDIGSSNIVNNNPLYYYFNEKGLDSSNFTQAGQVLLINCDDSIISNTNVSHCSVGISLWNCSKNIVFNNTVSFNYVAGISVNSYSNNNSFFRNNITTCYQSGIDVRYSHNNNISNCIIEECISGIQISDCNNTIILNNTAINNYGGIAIIAYYNPINNTLIRGNSMKGCGILIYAANVDENSFIIDTSNTVNSKALYYYSNKIGLTPSNFSNAGQIYLINCNSSLISDVDLSNTTVGLALQNCKNISLSNINVTHNKAYGLMILNCYNCSISKCVVNNNLFGLIAYGYEKSTISTNDFNNNTLGIQFNDCHYSIIHNNTFSYNKDMFNPLIGDFIVGGIGLEIIGSSYNNFTDNIIKNNKESGLILRENSTNNKILRNKIQNNNEFGIYIEDSYNPVVNTEILYNHLINNGIHAEDNGVNNKWDDGYAGNYWDNYIGIDSNPEDGIGDNLFSIQGIANAFDAKPLIYPIDEDTDGDMLYNYEEYTLGNDHFQTNVTNPDSDYDGLSDYWESENSTNPWESDTDFDYMPDLWEIDNDLNPLVDDSMDDPDSDDLENLYEYGNDTNPQENDTDGDTFLDGKEVGLGTSPLIPYWYPMPNLEILEFRAKAAKVNEPFTLNFTIINNGIWKAENVTIRISIELGNVILWDNINDTIDLDVNISFQDLIQISGVNTSGGLLMILELDPFRTINETYSLKNGSKRVDSESDNTIKTELQIVATPGNGGGLDLIWILLIIIGAVAFTGVISSYFILRPRFKRKSTIKRQIKTAKTDLDNFERNIRNFIRANLKDAYESNWWEEGIPEYIRNPVEKKINTMGAKEAKIGIDKMDYIDFLHYHSIITEKSNWDQVFSKIFPDKNVVENNFENLRVFKTNLYEGTIPARELSSHNIFIHAIRNYFTMGYNVFLSYSTLDADHYKIKEIANKLQSLPRIDKIFFWEADSGENIVTYMERTLRLSKVFVLFCTENSFKSRAVEDEWQVAFQLRKTGKMKIVPVYDNEEFIPYLLIPLLNVKYTKDDFDGFIQKLYEEIIR